MKHTPLLACTISFFFMILQACPAFSSTLGPAETIEDLRAMLEEAADGDTLLVSGDVAMDGGFPLTSEASVRITSQDGETAVLRGIRLCDINATFSNIHLKDSLQVTGISGIHLLRSSSVCGSEGQSALSFTGCGTLIIDPGCQVEGSTGEDGISIRHTGGELYVSIEGHVRGGSGERGGAGILVSPLQNSGAMLISGDIQGGRGTTLGGHALNLYDLSGNAYITVSGNLTGGSGFIGGDGIQLISAGDTVSVGISGDVKGGAGESHGGNALILMNAGGSSSFNLTGSFSGGDAIGESAQPGTSLQLVGDGAVVRARIDNCILEDGRYLDDVAKPNIVHTPHPTATPTIEPTAAPSVRPEVTPLPEITAPADNIAYIITPEPPL